MVDLRFLEAFAAVSLRLCRLLDVQFVPGAEAQASPIGRDLAEIISLNNARDVESRDMQLLRLAFVAQHLEQVAECHPEVMPWFRKRLLAPDLGSYVGARQELLVAAALSRARVDFVHDALDEPDFKVPGSRVGIECTTVHVNDWAERDRTYKIKSALIKKQQKAYAGADVALALGTTNIDAVSSFSTTREQLTDLLAATEFGSLVTFSIFVNHDGGEARLGSHYRRVDSPHASADLLDLLDHLWPVGELDVRHYSIPLTG